MKVKDLFEEEPRGMDKVAAAALVFYLSGNVSVLDQIEHVVTEDPLDVRCLLEDDGKSISGVLSWESRGKVSNPFGTLDGFALVAEVDLSVDKNVFKRFILELQQEADGERLERYLEDPRNAERLFKLFKLSSPRVHKRVASWTGL